MMIPIVWRFERKYGMNILEFNGICHEKKLVWPVIYEAVEIIDIADNFKGVPLEQIPESSATGNEELRVSFSLIFPSIKEIEKFERFLSKYYFE